MPTRDHDGERGESLRLAGNWRGRAYSAEGRAPSVTSFGIAPCRVVSSMVGSTGALSAGAWGAALLRIAGDHHLLALTAGAVEDGDGLAAGRRCGSPALRRRQLGGIGRRGGRTVVAGVLLAVAAVRLGRACARLLGDDHRRWLAAQGIVDEDRPAHHQQPEQP